MEGLFWKNTSRSTLKSAWIIVIRVNENAIPESLSRYLQIDTFSDGFLVTMQNYKKYGNYSKIEKNTCLCGLIILPDILI
jgi:hypothetical protein